MPHGSACSRSTVRARTMAELKTGAWWRAVGESATIRHRQVGG